MLFAITMKKTGKESLKKYLMDKYKFMNDKAFEVWLRMR